MKTIARLVATMLILPYFVGFTRVEDTASTSLEFSVGTGSYAEVARDCSGRTVSVRDVPFKEFGMGVTHRVSSFTFGASTGAMTHWRQNIVGSALADQEGNLFYLTPKVGIDTRYFGLDAGYLIPLNAALPHDLPGSFGHNSERQGLPSGMLRLGNRDSWFLSSSFANNIPLSTGGGLFDVGFGFSGQRPHSLYWIGVGAGPYDGVALSLKGNFPLSANFILNARAQAANREAFEYGIALGGKIIF